MLLSLDSSVIISRRSLGSTLKKKIHMFAISTCTCSLIVDTSSMLVVRLEESRISSYVIIVLLLGLIRPVQAGLINFHRVYFFVFQYNNAPTLNDKHYAFTQFSQVITQPQPLLF